MEKSFACEIAETILQQLGGHRFTVMTGSKNYCYGTNDKHNPYLQMCLARSKSKANRLTITYDIGSDTYAMKFWKYTASRLNRKTGKYYPESCKDIRVIPAGLFCDQLRQIFEEETGLYTSL